jgi:WD40 repeat protein
MRIIPMLVLLVIAATATLADTLHLKDGRVLEGSVEAQREGLVWFKHEVDGLIATDIFLENQINELSIVEVPEPEPERDDETEPDAIEMPVEREPDVETTDATNPPSPESDAQGATQVPIATDRFSLVLPPRPSRLEEGDLADRRPSLVYFTPGGHLIVGSYGYAGIWDLATGALVFEYDKDSPRGEPAASIDEGGALVTYKYVEERSQRPGKPTAIATRRNPETGRPIGKRAVPGVAKRKPRLEASRLDGRMTALAIRQLDGKPMVGRPIPSSGSGSALQVRDPKKDKTIAVLMTQSHKPAKEVREFDTKIIDHAFSSDDARVAAVLKDGTVNIWSSRTSMSPGVIDSGKKGGFPDSDARLRWTDQDRILVLQSKDWVVRIDPISGRVEKLYTRERVVDTGPGFQAVDPKAEVLNYTDQSILSPDLAWSLSLVQIYKEGVSGREIDRERYVLTDLALGKDIGMIDTPTGEDFYGTVFSPDSQHVAIGTRRGAVHVFTVDGLKDAARNGTTLRNTPLGGTLVANPLHHSWDGFGPGSTVERRTTYTSPAGNVGTYVTVTELMARDARTGDIALRSYDKADGPPKESTFDLTVARSPNMVRALVPHSIANLGVRVIYRNNSELPMRRLTLSVLGQRRPCSLLDTSKRKTWKPGSMASKLWFCETVPGFLVKSERRIQGRVTETVELIAMNRH